MLDALKNIMNLVSSESANLSGANVNGYKKKESFLSSSGDSLGSVGNDTFTRTDFSQGSLTPTSESSSLAIQGNGFFVLFSETATNNGTEQKLYFSRDGNFSFDQNGYLVNKDGLYVASLDQNGKLNKMDKKTFDGKGTPTDKFHFSANGILFNDSENAKEGKRLALASFANPQGLIASEKGGGVFVSSTSAGKALIDYPDRNNLGLVRDQSLEQSNASTVDSLANLGILQRFFPSTAAALKVSLSANDDLNNLIR